MVDPKYLQEWLNLDNWESGFTAGDVPFRWRAWPIWVLAGNRRVTTFNRSPRTAERHSCLADTPVIVAACGSLAFTSS